MKKNKPQNAAEWFIEIVNYAAFPIKIVLIWKYAVMGGGISKLLLPAPESVFQNFILQCKSGQLLGDIAASLSSVVRGYLVGAVLGLIFGILMGFSMRVNKFFGLIFNGVRQIPGLAWFPLIILWFGIGDMAKIVLVARGTFFPVLVNTIEGVQNTNPAYLDLVRLYKVKKKDVITKIYIPSALPFVCTGLRLGAGMAWTSVVAAEMMGAVSGLGFRITTAQQLMKSDVMLVDIIMIGVLGWVLDWILNKVTGRFDQWKGK
ncbi:MAG: ABC transporter permease [Blautia sp.]|nr:ABC transporter permease [Blautia sp.]MDY5032727.1 ABC transporter permease [Blautia sp.]